MQHLWYFPSEIEETFQKSANYHHLPFSDTSTMGAKIAALNTLITERIHVIAELKDPNSA
jgi:hypothetical protein